MSPQCARLLGVLRQKPITSLEILHELGIYRAGARVFDLKAQGYRVVADIVTVPNRHGETCRVARYALLPEGDTRDIREGASA